MLQQLSLKQIKSRIAGIGNIKKVTHAMQMIAASKLNAVEKDVFHMRRYLDEAGGILARVMSSAGEPAHPLFEERKVKKRVALCVITSNTGLCGAYNANAIHTAENFISTHGEENVDLIVVGRKAFKYFKKRVKNISGSFLALSGVYPHAIYKDLSEKMIDLYLSKTVDEAYIIYTHLDPAFRCRLVIEKFLGLGHLKGKDMGYIFESEPHAIVEQLLPVYLSCKMRSHLLDSYAAEQFMRTIAMKEAAENAEELLESLILSRNKVRQASITKEILEISSTAEVLR